MTAVALLVVLVGSPGPTGASGPPAPVPASAAATLAADPATLGTSASTAAGSCWDIKQQRPTAADGVYWLETPRMAEAAQFYCDMTTDGGGWVLIGKGRDGWGNAYEGKGDVVTLTSPGLTPMSSATTQLPSATVDALLNGGRVDALSDGIRLRRATNGAGTTWQEARFSLAKRDRWVWTLAAEHPLAGWSFAGVTGTGGTTQATWGTDQAYNRVKPTGSDSQLNHLGFAFGTSVIGSSSSSTYLWSATEGKGGALPYTQMYLRPKVTSSDAAFTSIPDAGAARITQPAVPRNRALDSPWGVTGLAGSTADEGDVEVQALAQSGNTMFVGGNFRYAQRDVAGTDRVEQPFLAGFDVTTGQLVTTFRPTLNEQVRTLATLPDGTLAVGGDFTVVNGLAASGVVELDPVTGATRTAFKLKVENRLTGGVLHVRSLDVRDGYLYLGGAFTHLTGGTRVATVYARSLARVNLTDGTPSTDWIPNLNGTVSDIDVSDDGARVFASGYFGTANGTVASNRAAAISTAAGAVATAWTPTWSSTKNYYQHTVEQAGGRVYVGGSEHSLFGFDPGTLERKSGSIMKQNGDIQVVDYHAGTGLLFAGCHCNDFSYQNAFTWSAVGTDWTQADALNWFGAWDASTGARVPQFVPALSMREGSGIWAIATDSTGTVWAGGDVVAATTKTQAGKWSGGFARWDASDSTAPPTPSGFAKSSETTDSVTFTWKKVADASPVHYQVLRDDRTVGATTANTTSITVPKGGSGRYFLRAADSAGNVSATTGVLVVGSAAVVGQPS